MEFFYQIAIFFNQIDVICFDIWCSIYNTVYSSFNLTLGYCPIFYQLMYFYLPLTLYIRIRRINKTNTEIKKFYNSTYNYIFFLSKNLFIFLIQNFQNLMTMYIYFLKKLSIYFVLIKTFFKKSFNFFWRPLFKKISYFGLYSSVRSKWYKNKK